MADIPGFGGSLARCARRRHRDTAGLSRLVGVPEAELTAVLAGAEPSSSFLREVAPALGMHTSDLFVIAGLAVPDDLAPMGRKERGMQLAHLVLTVGRLREPQRSTLREVVRSLPQEAHTPPTPPSYERYPSGPGGLVLRLLHNRDMDWLASAVCLYGLTGVGPLSASTVGMVGRGKKELTANLAAAFATILGIAVDDLADVTGVGLPARGWVAKPAAAEAASFIWDTRRLTDQQMDQVAELAGEMKRDSAAK
jgi:hypothetical protein